jgi:hypothetical protein
LAPIRPAFERIEQRLEEFDVHAMRGEGADKDIEVASPRG